MANDREAKLKRAARAAVYREIRAGRIPKVSTLKCKDCGVRATRYDHHNGYDEPHRLDVEPICERCDGIRTARRNSLKDALADSVLRVYSKKGMDPIIERAIEKLGSVPEAAKKLNVSKSLLYMILRGQRTPTDALLSKLGLTRVELITRAK